MLLRQGIRCVHLQSSAVLPAEARLGDFEQHFLFDGDLGRLVSELAMLAPEFVIPGNESGVLLADAVSEALGLPGNGTEQSLARRNKHRLAEQLRSRGVRAVPTFEVARVEAAVAIAESIGEWPVVVKPVDSSGSDGLHFCANPAEVRAAATELLGRMNFLGLLNRTVIVQRRIVGQQYYLLAVSREGRHYFCEIWRDDRIPIPGAGVMPDLNVLLPAAGAISDELRTYASACLDAVGIRIGPSFLEIIKSEDGPVLIDLGARMMGTQDFEVLESVLGTSQLHLTTACYADPAAFAAMTAQAYRARMQLWVVTLLHRGPRVGRLLDNSWQQRLAGLASFRSIYGAPRPGQLLRPTADEATSPGAVFLAHEDIGQLESDYRQIRELESKGHLFRVEALCDGAQALALQT